LQKDGLASYNTKMGVLNNRIVTRGLAYYHDTNNPKSYAGPAGTNLITNLVGSSGSGTGYSYDTGYQNVYIPGLQQTVSSNYVDVQNNYSTSGACCPAPIYFGSPNVTGSTVYTYALLVKSSKGYLNGNTMYHYEYGASGYITEFGLYSSSYQIDMGDGWYWIYNTFTTNSATTTIYLYSFYYLYATTFDRLYVAKALFMKGNFLNMHPSLWPPLQTTRSSTQSVLDLTGNCTANVSNAGYDSNGKIYFDGSSGNYLAVSTSLGVVSNYSICFWARRDAENRMPVSSLANTSFYWYGDNSWRYTHGGTGGEYYYPKAVSIPTGTWGFYCVVYDGSYVNIYRNGYFEGRQATSGTADWTGGLMIGYWTAGSGYMYQGYINNLKFYNVALTSNEVLQNFYAHRAQYGI